MKKPIILLVVLIVIALFFSFKPTGNIISQEQALAIKDVDGDTIKLSSGENVRFLNIDTPERGQYMWKEASNRMKQLSENKTVILEPDKTNKDKYGRLLRYVYVNDTMLNLIMVKEGFARAYYIAPDDKYLDEIKKAEAEAKSKNLGIWRYDNIIGAFCVWVYDLRDNPKGRDEDNLNGEYVVFRNSCTHPVDLTDWKVRASRGSFTFPGFTLNAKKLVTLHSGSGTNNATDVYWGSPSAIWKNEHDTLLAYNSDGRLALNYSY